MESHARRASAWADPPARGQPLSLRDFAGLPPAGISMSMNWGQMLKDVKLATES
ncbi:MAG: hypothetical protein ACLUEQ_02625 [Cloacibacillus evryensis]